MIEQSGNKNRIHIHFTKSLISSTTAFLGLFSAAVFILSSMRCLAQNQGNSGEAGSKQLDAYTGKYIICGSHAAKLEKVDEVSIVKENGSCRILGTKAWKDCRFTIKSKNSLFDSARHIGSLVPGTIRFADGGSRKVIRADFCYDYFLLVSSSFELPLKKESEAGPGSDR